MVLITNISSTQLRPIGIDAPVDPPYNHNLNDGATDADSVPHPASFLARGTLDFRLNRRGSIAQYASSITPLDMMAQLISTLSESNALSWH